MFGKFVRTGSAVRKNRSKMFDDRRKSMMVYLTFFEMPYIG